MLGDEICSFLKMVACELALQKIDRKRITHELCDAIVQTDWQTQVVGARAGVLFRAQVFAEKGDYFVNFLLNEDDLKRGGDVIRRIREHTPDWGELSEDQLIPELLEFRDLRKHKLH